ncbi:MAG TPA: hypothetical protein VLW50_12150 [Streptosporangiaceae bacterium]|nr:hypothetical protein [Streptosporangiaceae bacterium]
MNTEYKHAGRLPASSTPAAGVFNMAPGYRGAAGPGARGPGGPGARGAAPSAAPSAAASAAASAREARGSRIGGWRKRRVHALSPRTSAERARRRIVHADGAAAVQRSAQRYFSFALGDGQSRAGPASQHQRQRRC